MDSNVSIYEHIDMAHYAENYDQVTSAVTAGEKFQFRSRPDEIVKIIHTAEKPELPVLEVPVNEAPKELQEVSFEPETKELLSCMTEAQLNAKLFEQILERISSCDSKLEEW